MRLNEKEMEINGKITKVFDVQSGTSANGNAWRRRDFIVEFWETDRYPDRVLLALRNERIDAVELKEGDEVRVGFAHNVHEYNGRWFNELSCYRLERLNPFRERGTEPSAVGQQPPVQPQSVQQPPQGGTGKEGEDALPF